jgi:ankyrin repeat protein
MSYSYPRFALTGAVAILLVAGTAGFAPEHHTLAPISADEFVRAVAQHRTSLIDLYFREHLDPNARAAQDRPILLAATLQRDSETVRRLLQAGACVDLADQTGLTPLMAAAMVGDMESVRDFVGGVTNISATDRSGRTALQYAVAAKQIEVTDLLLRMMPGLGPRASDLLATALDTADKKMIDLVFTRIPIQPTWRAKTIGALTDAVKGGNNELVKMLLQKHSVPPTPEGKSVPLLAYAIAAGDAALFNALIAGGAEPNTTLPAKCDKDFLESISAKMLRAYIEEDKGVTVLMLAAGLGRPEYVRALLEVGADRNRATTRWKMIALYLAAQNRSWQCTQILLGSGPPPDQLHIEITLASQQVSLIKDGVPIFNTVCSTGREGYSTQVGDYVITDKERSHRSTIYKVEMPYFMRLSCLDFGMHSGVVPNYPASHGCIRLPDDAARKLFAEIPIGTLVNVK